MNEEAPRKGCISTCLGTGCSLMITLLIAGLGIGLAMVDSCQKRSGPGMEPAPIERGPPGRGGGRRRGR